MSSWTLSKSPLLLLTCLLVCNTIPPSSLTLSQAEQEASDLSGLAERVIQATVEGMSRRLEESSIDIPWYDEGNTKHLSLVRLRAMIQHDSIGDQLFVPLGVDRDGVIQNLGLFGLAAHLEDSGGIAEECELMGRRMVVVTPPPSYRGASSFRRVLVLLYGHQEIKVNDVVEIIGIFEAPPVVEEDMPLQYPYGLPIIHAICLSSQPTKLASVGEHECTALRSRLCTTLARLGLQEGGATLFMLSLLSNISNRTPGLLTSLLVGYFPLNVRLPKNASEDAFVEHLSELCPNMILLPLSRQTLENEAFESRMDYETGILYPGALQIPDGTLVVIDERTLEPGKLSEAAARNLQCLIHLITHQVVHYDFGGYPVPIPTNVPIISLSHGKSILPIDCWIEASERVVPCAEGPIECFAEYIEQCRRVNVNISPATAAEIEADYLCRRSESSGRFKANDLSHVLNLGRLVAASYASSELDIAHYQEALSLWAWPLGF